MLLLIFQYLVEQTDRVHLALCFLSILLLNLLLLLFFSLLAALARLLLLLVGDSACHFDLVSRRFDPVRVVKVQPLHLQDILDSFPVDFLFLLPEGVVAGQVSRVDRHLDDLTLRCQLLEDVHVDLPAVVDFVQVAANLLHFPLAEQDFVLDDRVRRNSIELFPYRPPNVLGKRVVGQVDDFRRQGNITRLLAPFCARFLSCAGEIDMLFVSAFSLSPALGQIPPGCYSGL